MESLEQRLVLSGIGLQSQYFNSSDLSRSPVLVRNDATVNFDWGTGSPDAAVNADNLSERWVGEVEASLTETHTFYINANDGARLWVNGQLLVDQFDANAVNDATADIHLIAGRRYEIQLEYREVTGDAFVRLEWESDSRSREVIPQSQLFAAEYGSLSAERFSGIVGGTVASLTGDADFPDNADVVFESTSFEATTHTATAEVDDSGISAFTLKLQGVTSQPTVSLSVDRDIISEGGLVGSASLLVPAYANPASDPQMWDNLISAATTNAINVILNPNSGPGDPEIDPNYINASGVGPAIDLNIANQTGGGRIVGYVATGFGERNIDDVLADIDQWYDTSYWRGAGVLIGGIFLDEMSNDLADVGYYQTLRDHVKSRDAASSVIGNPGTTFTHDRTAGAAGFTVADYANSADVLVTFENTADEYRQNYTPPSWVDDYTADRFAHILHSESNARSVPELLNLATARNAGMLYITNDEDYGQLADYWTGTANITARLSIPSENPVTVDVSFSGTASNPDDYLPSTSRLVIPAGERSASFSILAVQDSTTEATETLGVTIDNVINATGSGTVTVDIADDDPVSLSLVVSESIISENGGSATATISRTGDTTSEVVVDLRSSDIDEAMVPAEVTIPAGQISATFTVSAVDDGILDAASTVVLTATAAGFGDSTAEIVVEDLLNHRMSQLTIIVQDQNGNPLPDATLDVTLTQHDFTFGTQVRDRLFGLTDQSEFDALSDTQKQGLLPGGAGFVPTWTDVVNYREAVLTHFNHIVPTNGVQWFAFNNAGPANVDTAINLAHDEGLTVTGHSAVWGKDDWPTPNQFRPAANPDPQVFLDTLIADRLSSTGVLARYSDSGAGPTVTDWDVLNEPLHEHYYANTFVNAGFYANSTEFYADIFRRAHAVRPDARLAVNDYNIISSNGDAAAREYRDFVNAVNAELAGEDAAIEVIKVQAHIGRSDLSKDDIVRRLDILAETGLPIVISEFDMRDDAGQLSISQQQTTFRNFLEASFEHPSVEAFTMWGFWDPGHWRGNGPLYNADWSFKDEASPWTDLVEGDWMSEQLNQPVDANGRWTNDRALFDGTYTVTAMSGDRSTTLTGYQLTADGQLFITIDVSNGNAGAADIDGDGQANAATDGILFIRHLLGFTEDALINNAVGAGAANSTSAEIIAAIEANPAMQDIDGDGNSNAATDGILFLRYLLGFSGTSLTDNAVGSGAIRTTGPEIVAFLDGFQPGADGGSQAEVFDWVSVSDAPAPTIVWPTTTDATRYRLRITDVSNDQTLEDVQPTIPNYTLSTTLPSGTYRIWLTALNSSGGVIAEFFATLVR